MKIISASRRTDIPAFYGTWFMNRIAEGFAGYINPFNNKKYIVSLKKADVAAIALWSKNFIPFIKNALHLKEQGYPLFFNYTITGLSDNFEPEAPPEYESVESLKQLSSIFSPDQINWRYDPILISDITGEDYHLEKFESLCRSLTGHVKRCYISFPSPYGKVERSFKNFTDRTGIRIISYEAQGRINLAEKLANIAARYNINMNSCCGDYLTGGTVSKGHCIDGYIISAFSGINLSGYKIRPTRKECGCTESTDIGVYDSCPHGCIYCYANSTLTKASSFYKQYQADPGFSRSAFLGVPEETSHLWIKDIKNELESSSTEEPVQPSLF